MTIEVGHEWARKMIQELCDLGHHGGTLMLYVDEQERRDSQLSAAAARVAELETAARHSERLLATFEEENVKLDSRRIEGRQLLRRMVKYVREDRAVTPGKTRLERLTSQVADYLNRTHEPRDILRAEQAKK